MDTASKPMYECLAINWGKTHRLVFKLQKRIYRASERGDVKAVRRLQRLLTKSWYAKTVAVRQVTEDNRSKNIPGIDRVSGLRNNQKISLAENLELKEKFQPPIQVWIPKLGKEEMGWLCPVTLKGVSEHRHLNGLSHLLPKIREKAKQALLKLALEPEWEAKFEPNSYGFRPSRSHQNAIAAIYNGIAQKKKYVLDAEIEKCCNKVNHIKLLDKLNTTPTFRKQIRVWLKSGIMDGDVFFPAKESQSKEGDISNLLTNIALHGMEGMLMKNFSRRTGRIKSQHKPNFIRYASSFVLMDESLEVVLEAKQLIEEWLKKIGLVLNESKTRITHTLIKHQESTGFDFLGFNIRQYPCNEKQNGSIGGAEIKPGYKTLIKPSKSAIKQHFLKIDDLLAKNANSSQEKVINALNSAITNWTAYYSTCTSSNNSSNMDKILHQKLFSWAKKRRNRRQSNTEVISNYWGVNRGKGWKFMTPDNKYVLKTYQDTPIQRYVKRKQPSSTSKLP